MSELSRQLIRDALAPRKKCTVCGEFKELAEFYRNGARAHRRSPCKACGAAAYRAAHPRKLMRCAQCGLETTRHGRKRFCSSQCRRAAVALRSKAPLTERKCSICDSPFLTTAGSRRGICRSTLCNSRRSRALRLGINPSEYHRALEERSGACACCGHAFKEGQRQMHVDHNHVTGKVRGVLCHNCNLGLGHVHEDPEKLFALGVYLARHTFDLVDLCHAA